MVSGDYSNKAKQSRKKIFSDTTVEDETEIISSKERFLRAAFLVVSDKLRKSLNKRNKAYANFTCVWFFLDEIRYEKML